MKCPECGAEVDAGERFCGNCGAPLETAPAAPTAEQPQAFVRDETILSAPPASPVQEPAAPPFTPEPQSLGPSTPPAEPPLSSLPRESERPAYAPPAPPSVPPPGEGQRKSKTGLIIGIVVAVLILLCCCIAVVIFVFLNSDAGRDLMWQFRQLGMAAPVWASLA